MMGIGKYGKGLTTVCIFLCLYGSVQAQREANNWFFGVRAGLSFKTGSAVPQHGSAMVTYSSSVVASDPETGALLFYSNGESVWDRYHQLMPNGTSLFVRPGTNNQVYIVPHPGETDQYLIFTLTQANYATGEGASVYYSIVDMGLNDGAGDVVANQKNILLGENFTEKIAAVKKSNNQGYWLVLHQVNSNNFVVYEITSQGLSFHHINSVGEIHAIEVDNIEQVWGHMKFSPNNRFLGVTLHSLDFPGTPFQLFEFDPETGDVSKPINLGLFVSQYGVSFSPDSRKLYVHGYMVYDDTYDFLHQFDLSAANIEASRIGLLVNNPALNRHDFGTGFANFHLQLGPDGRLYGAGARTTADDQLSRNSLLVISTPNELGYNCDVSLRRFDFGEGKVNISLPNFLQGIFEGLTSENNPNAPCTPDVFAIYPNPTNRFLSIDFSGECTPYYTIHVYDALGRSTEKYTAFGNSMIDLNSFASGMYLFQVYSGTRKFTKKIIKL